VLAAAGAHAACGGTVDLTGAGWAFAALAGPAWWVTGRERGWAMLAGAQLAAQQVAHVAMAGPAADVHAGGLLPMDLMLYLHLAAAALAAVWLRIGERRAWAAARAVLRICVLVVAGPLPVVGVPSTRCPAAPVARVRSALLRHALARRGPPVPAA
jgi:hypothetical protein